MTEKLCFLEVMGRCESEAESDLNKVLPDSVWLQSVEPTVRLKEKEDQAVATAKALVRVNGPESWLRESG